VISLAQQVIDFACENFKEQETVYEGFLYQYESEIENVALGIEAHLQKNVNHKKSSVIKQFVLDVINTEKYGRGRSGFVYLLHKLKMDKELNEIATERKDFWETPRIQFQLLYALYRRRIKGFSKEAEQLIQNNPKETALKKYANKYIEQQAKAYTIRAGVAF
jgi:exonuclease VII large subunit